MKEAGQLSKKSDSDRAFPKVEAFLPNTYGP